jgi:hypothetical protein
MIGRVLGHTNAATTQRYAHLQADPLRALVDAAGARMTAGMRKPEGDGDDDANIVRMADKSG